MKVWFFHFFPFVEFTVQTGDNPTVLADPIGKSSIGVRELVCKMSVRGRAEKCQRNSVTPYIGYKRKSSPTGE
jgi:hypothetical protein